MGKKYDVAVIGLGVLGASALWRLAARGLAVVGIDQHPVGHSLGSSHGRTRLYREACLEHPGLVVLARTSAELLGELEQTTGVELLVRTPAVMLGPEEGEVISGTKAALAAGGLDHEELTVAELRRLLPRHRDLPEETVGLVDRAAGVMRAEEVVTTTAAAAGQRGAEVVRGYVEGIDVSSASVVVRLGGGGTIEAEQVVLALGAWLPAFGSGLPVEAVRTPMTWFTPAGGKEDSAFDLERFPVFVREASPTEILWGHGSFRGSPVKIGINDLVVERERIDADTVDRGVSRTDVAEIREIVERRIIGLDPVPARVDPCMITRTPDGQFLVGPSPGDERVIVLGGCNGHAFKHAAALGEIVASYAIHEAPFTDVSFLRPDRFSDPGGYADQHR